MTKRAYVRGPLDVRFWSKVDRRGPGDCWLWTGGITRGRGRESLYGNIKEGPAGSRTWRANRLALLLSTPASDVPRDDDESVLDRLRRVDRYYEAMDASHLCDVSLCCNPEHLAWETHTANVVNQRARRAARRSASTAPTSISPSIDSVAVPLDGRVLATAGAS